MIEIQAPYPDIQAVCLLPNPQFNDIRHLNSEVNLKRSMSGVRYSYVKNKEEETFVFNFILTRWKSLELFDFIRQYGSDKWRLINHDDIEIIGNLITNPNTLTKTNRAAIETDEEQISITFEFKGIVQ